MSVTICNAGICNKKTVSLVKNLRPFCLTGQIGCSAKQIICILTKHPIVHSGGVSGGGSAINGAMPSSFDIGVTIRTL